MEIIYTAKAKNDLTRIHWKTRNSLINYISQYKQAKNIKKTDLKLIQNTELYKLPFNDYIAVSKVNEDTAELNILTVLEKKKIKLPE